MSLKCAVIKRRTWRTKKRGGELFQVLDVTYCPGYGIVERLARPNQVVPRISLCAKHAEGIRHAIH